MVTEQKIKMVFYAKPSFRFILVQNGKTDTNLRLEKGKVGGSPVYGKGQGFTERDAEARIPEDRNSDFPKVSQSTPEDPCRGITPSQARGGLNGSPGS